MSELVCGVDEAGRGPVIGPMVLCAALFDTKGANKLRELNVRDSKKIAEKKRIELEPLIQEIAVDYKIKIVSPLDIDRLRKRDSLNEIEARKMAELILALESTPTKIILDAADSVAINYGKRVSRILHEINKNYVIPPIVSEHKADDKYVEVGAASVLAKVERDRQIDNLRRKYGNFGSGYPADEVTQRHIKELMAKGTLPDYVRKSWNTVKQEPGAPGGGAQSKLGEY